VWRGATFELEDEREITTLLQVGKNRVHKDLAYLGCVAKETLELVYWIITGMPTSFTLHTTHVDALLCYRYLGWVNGAFYKTFID